MVTLSGAPTDSGIVGRVISLRRFGARLPTQWHPPLAAVADRAFLSMGRRVLARNPWVVNPVGRRLYVDPKDPRAARLRISGGNFDRPVARLWQQMVQDFDPDVAVDVGCNYGEIILFGQYSPRCRLVAVEASPAIQPYLARSLAESLPEVQLKRVAASDTSSTLRFTIDQSSSGLSHVADEGEISVPAIRLDTLDELAEPGQRLLIKIDVEGHEDHVLRGLEGAFARAADWRAIIEFVHLPVETKRALAQTYTVSLVSAADGRTTPATETELATFQELVQSQTCLKDVVLSPR